MAERKETGRAQVTPSVPATGEIQADAPPSPPAAPPLEYGLKEMPQIQPPRRGLLLSSLASLRHDLTQLVVQGVRYRPGQGRGDQLYHDQAAFDAQMRERAIDLVTAFNRAVGGELPIDRLTKARHKDEVLDAIAHLQGQVDAAEKMVTGSDFRG